MSIATAITNAQGKVADAYTAVSGKGGTLPATQDLSNLPNAIISIPTGASSIVAGKLSGNCGIFNSAGAAVRGAGALNSSGSVNLAKGKTYYVKQGAGTWYDSFTITIS